MISQLLEKEVLKAIIDQYINAKSKNDEKLFESIIAGIFEKEIMNDFIV